MKLLPLRSIKESTLSTGAASTNAVYEAQKDTVIFLKNNREVDIKKGQRAIISGCGAKKPGFISYFLIGNEWGVGLNADWEHVFNPILMEHTE